MFLDAGYSPSLFWDLSLGEVGDLIESYNRRKEDEVNLEKARMQAEAAFLYTQAMQICNMLSKLVDDKTEVKPLKSYYPNLFDESKADFTEQEKDKPELSPEMELHKARMDDFIFRHNMALKKAQQRGEGSGRNDP